jgi:RNA polymerase sigma-70 factor (ECF subfamily)
MDEGDLAVVVAEARAGDRAALAELYRRFGARVFGLCRHLLGAPEAAEDARGEVFLKLPGALAGYDPAQPFTPWLLSIASHHCLDRLRRRRVEARLFVPAGDEPRLGDGATTPGPSPLGQVLLDERQEAVRAAIAALPTRYRAPLVLRYYAELGYDDIARTLGLEKSHVATLIFRAKHALRRQLQPTGPAGAEELRP